MPPPSPGVTGGGDSLLSPPSVASLLDISLPGPPEEALAPGEPQTHISDSIIELAINSAHYGVCLCPYPTICANISWESQGGVYALYFCKSETLQMDIALNSNIYTGATFVSDDGFVFS